MKRLLLLLAITFFAADLAAQVRYDTLSTRGVGPGMIHTEILAPDVPWTIDVLEVDLTNPYVRMKSVKGNDRLSGFERTSQMAARNDAEGHRVVGAINADFFLAGGVPVSMQIAEGHVLRRQASNRPGIGFSPDNDVELGVPVFSSRLILPDTSVLVQGVNESRGENQMILYNRFFGPNTSTNQFGTEVSVRSLDGWVVNDTVSVVVEQKSGAGAMTISDDNVVLSGHGTMASFLSDHVAVDDTLRLAVRALPGIDEVTELVSGGPFLVRNGTVDVGPRGDGSDRHPRTSIGVNEDETKLYMVTVDGRQTTSSGIDLYDLAELMIALGVHTGINLDGGGSTTMVIRGDIVNSPSDSGGERSVSNALLAVSTAPTGELNAIQLEHGILKLFRGRSYQFAVRGVDEHFNPLDLNPDQLTFSAEEGIGTIDDAGNFVASTEPDTGYVRVTYGDYADSTQVIIKDIARIVLSPQSIVTDTLRTISFDVTPYDVDNARYSVATSEYEWEVIDETIGEVDGSGGFRGLRTGTTQVVASYKAISDTATVVVEVGEGEQILDAFESLAGWSVQLQELDAEGSGASIVEVDGENVLQVDYQFDLVSGGGPYRLFLNKTHELYGVPDSVHVDVKSDGLRHRLMFEARDANGSSYTVYATSFATETEEFVRISAPIDRPNMVHPIRLTSMGVQLGNTGVLNETNEGSLLLRNLRVSYPDPALVSSEEAEALPERFVLHQNYPNPFNPSTTIRYEVRDAGRVTLRVVNVLGQVVETLVDRMHTNGTFEVTWDASAAGGVASGIYFYSLEADGIRLARPMILMK